MRPTGSELAGEVLDRLQAGEPCWLPGLGARLAEGLFAEGRGVGSEDYSTAAWLGEGGPSDRLTVPGRPSIAIELLPAALSLRFQGPDLDDIADEAPEAVAKALDRLDRGGAGEAVAAVIRSIHCIRSAGPGFDSSHSEPGIPFSVLVSLPAGERHADLRLAESLLHEAMHLQLTLVELEAPIVDTEGDAGTGYSPWQRCERPAQGLLHGFFVFSCIRRWLGALDRDPELSRDDRAYVDRRLSEIREELSAVGALEEVDGLTPFGRSLVRSLRWSPH